MGVIIPEGFGIIKWRWSIVATGEEVISTYGYLNGGGTVQEDADQAFLDGVASGDGPLDIDKIAVQYNRVGVEATLMTSTGPVSAEHVSVVQGSAGGTPLTINTCILAKKITARGGRNGRGRFYLPGGFCPEANVDEIGQIQTSNHAALQGMMSAWLTEANSNSVPPYLLHSDATAPDALTSIVVERIVATQRRRLRR